MQLTCLKFPGSSFLPFYKRKMSFVFFQSMPYLPTTMIDQYYQESLWNVIWQLPLSLWVHPTRAHGSMHMLKNYLRSITQSFFTKDTSTLLCIFILVSGTWDFCSLVSSSIPNRDWGLQNFLSIRIIVRVRRRLESSRSSSYTKAEVCIEQKHEIEDIPGSFKIEV